ncbi:MAG TPA: glucose 1-dehydrogenase [Candidatus Baltobacteraceae bacterium]|nr:glucose 1-dehydrogenase [Candidatus Baltobacteraceae bacterium]
MKLLEGKVALVTGAAVGIGRAIAEAFGREGAKVGVNYSKSKADADQTAALVKQAGGEALPLKADVSQDVQARAMVDELIKRFGRLDILVNNAGITAFVDFANLDGLTDDVWDRLYAVNVKGTFFCCRAAVPQMRKQGEGRIINLASVAGLAPNGSSIAYCCSKAAVVQMSKCLAKTLGPEIAVNVIAPGFIAETRWNVGRPNLEKTVAGARQSAPLKRVGTPEDIAAAALFLATRGDFMTGDVMVVDGGRLVG